MRTPGQLARLLATAFVTSVAVATAGCASGRVYSYDAPAGVGVRSMALRVTNDNWHDVTIYLLRDGGAMPTRIGAVSGLNSRVLRLRHPPAGWIRLMIRPIGSQASFTTNQVVVEPGQVMVLRVQNHLAYSSLHLAAGVP
jgi:hypothetical protein